MALNLSGIWCVTVLSAASLLAFACSREQPKSDSRDATKSVAPSSDALVIGFSDPGNLGIFAYAKREGILEKELAQVNAKIAWIPAAGAFSANFDAMNSGVMNASGGAISPIVGALAHNLPFRIFAIADPGGTTRAGIVAPAQSSIRKVEDLADKRVAVNFAAHGDYILLKALANANIPSSRVERVAIQPPEAAAAFATGKIDAWSTFGVFFSTAVRNGAHIIALEKDLNSDDVGVLSASTVALEKNPAAFQVIVRVARELVALARQKPEQFVNVFTDKGPTALAGEELAITLEETRVLPEFRVPTENDRKRVHNVSRVFYENKSIDRELSVDQIVFDLDRATQVRAAANPPLNR